MKYTKPSLRKLGNALETIRAEFKIGTLNDGNPDLRFIYSLDPAYDLDE